MKDDPHLCHCGKYGTFGVIREGKIIWFCMEHSGHSQLAADSCEKINVDSLST